MTTEQKDLIAIVFDMHPNELRAALYCIVIGDDIHTALDKARAKQPKPKKQEEKGMFG